MSMAGFVWPREVTMVSGLGRSWMQTDFSPIETIARQLAAAIASGLPTISSGCKIESCHAVSKRKGRKEHESTFLQGRGGIGSRIVANGPSVPQPSGRSRILITGIRHAAEQPNQRGGYDATSE